MDITPTDKERLAVRLVYSNKKPFKLFIFTRGLRNKPVIESFKNIKTKDKAQIIVDKRNKENLFDAIWIDNNHESISLI